MISILIIIWAIGVLGFGYLLSAGSKDYPVIRPYMFLAIVWPIVMVIAIVIVITFLIVPPRGDNYVE